MSLSGRSSIRLMGCALRHADRRRRARLRLARRRARRVRGALARQWVDRPLARARQLCLVALELSADTKEHVAEACLAAAAQGLRV